MNRSLALLCLVALLLLVSACAPGANSLAHSPDPAGHVAGFWLGLWHGAISPFTFVISLFNSNVSPYEVHNNGGWYNLGFLLAIGAFTGGGAAGAARRR